MARQREKMWRRAPTSFRWAHSRPPRPSYKSVGCCLTNGATSDIYQQHDIYLSLHRSEGYGLTIREAMLHGLHVVAMGWSGNMEFMHGENCHAVSFRIVPVRFNRGPCKGLTTRWTEADTDAAASILHEIAAGFQRVGLHEQA